MEDKAVPMVWYTRLATMALEAIDAGPSAPLLMNLEGIKEHLRAAKEGKWPTWANAHMPSPAAVPERNAPASVVSASMAALDALDAIISTIGVAVVMTTEGEVDVMKAAFALRSALAHSDSRKEQAIDIKRSTFDYAMELVILWGREEYQRGRHGLPPSEHNPTLTKLAAALAGLRDVEPKEDWRELYAARNAPKPAPTDPAAIWEAMKNLSSSS